MAKEPIALRRSPEIRPTSIWPTPEGRSNLVFWVEKDMTLPKHQAWVLGTAHKNKKEYPDHKLIHVTPEDQDKISRWYYASDRVSEDNYNFEHTAANIGGQTFDAVRRSYLTLRSSYSESVPAAGAAMPVGPSAKFPVGYVLSGRTQQRTGDDTFDGLYVVEYRDYVKKVSIAEIGVDDLNGGALSSSDTLYYATEVVTGALTATALFAAPTNAYWGLQADGTKRSGKQLSEDWYLITSQDVVSGTFVGGVVLLDPGGEYTTNDDHYWPPVLLELEFMDWERRDGGTDIYPRYEFEPDVYQGPCKTTVERSWSRNPQTIPAVVPMMPTPIPYGSPFFRLAVPSCLHWAVDAQCDIGSNDPIYSLNSGSLRTVDETNHVVWPGSIIGYDDQVPFRGGFLRVKKTIAAPSP